MAKEIIFGDAKVGDYVAVTVGESIIMVGDIKRVTQHQIVVGDNNHYWRDTGRRVHESTRGDNARPSTKREYDAWINREDGVRKRREREEAARKAEAEKEESRITADIANALEFHRDTVKKLPIWRLRMAYAALLGRPDAQPIEVIDAAKEPITFS